MRTFRYMVRTHAPGVIGAVSVLAAGKIAQMVGMDPSEVTMVICCLLYTSPSPRD